MDCLQSSKKKGNHWTSLLNILTRLIQVQRRPRFLFFIRMNLFFKTFSNPRNDLLSTGCAAASTIPPVCSRRRRLLLTLRMFSVPHTSGIAGHSGSSSIFIGSRDRIRRRDTCYVSPS